MRKKAYLYVFVTIAVCGLAHVGNAENSPWESISGARLDIGSIALSSDGHTLYMAERNSLNKSTDGGQTWKRVFRVNSSSTRITAIEIHPHNDSELYIGTDKGLYCSTDAGLRWRKVFNGTNADEAAVRCVKVVSFGAFIGTRAGLFLSRDMGTVWHKQSIANRDEDIRAIACEPANHSFLLVAGHSGVYRSLDAGANWQRVYDISTLSGDQDVSLGREISGEYQGDESNNDSGGIFDLAIDPDNPRRIYLVTSRGMYASDDSAATWHAFDDAGISSGAITALYCGSKSVLLAADKGELFQNKCGQWHKVKLAGECRSIRDVIVTSSGRAFIASDRGAFTVPLSAACPEEARPETLPVVHDGPDLPTIQEVQRAAIAYADAELSKIRQWRRQASSQAWLPTVSLDVDRNVTDLWHWETGSSTRTGDDALTRGKDTVTWGIQMSWDLSKLIWNDDQTSIDVRSKLMVELRDDIIDEATKLYYERRRLQEELRTYAPADARKRFDKQLRLQEVTALLDAMTAGLYTESRRSLNPLY